MVKFMAKLSSLQMVSYADFFLLAQSAHLLLCTCVLSHMAWLGYFPSLLYHDWESNLGRFSGTSLRDLNSGRFSD